jgi:tRNA (uracil-5-)-methyltransferase TRM9
MEAEICQKLIALNRHFYQAFGPAFAATRRRLQPGVERILETIPSHGSWLDLGCGSGALAARWAASGRTGRYLGLDFSQELLNEARQAIAGLTHPGLEIDFQQLDLTTPAWDLPPGQTFDGVLAFAVLHHIPQAELRLQILTRARGLLQPGGRLIHSEWQLTSSPRLAARRVRWEKIGLTAADVENGDTLIDWRYALPGQPEQIGLRYVHLFNRAELDCLAEDAGFEPVDEFESDGEGGHLGLYQVWKAR